MALIFLFTVLVDDLNNVSQFITMSFFKVTYKFKKLDFLKSIVVFVSFFNFCLTVELLVHFNLIKIN